MNDPEKPSVKSHSLKNITPRQYLIAFIKFQALWCFFYAAESVTYLPDYIRNVQDPAVLNTIDPNARLALVLHLFRIVMNIAAAMLIIQYTQLLVDYLLKDTEEKDLEDAE